MTENTRPSGEIVAENVSIADFFARYMDQHVEWVRGYVINMPPEGLQHQDIISYLESLFKAYFALRPGGRVITEKFVLRLDDAEVLREPDLMVILGDNLDNLASTAMNGPADICVEVVSPESAARDYGEKFVDYEIGGVREYWIVDPLRTQCQFHRLGDDGVYHQVAVQQNSYTTPLLPDLSLPVPTLWTDPLPDYFQIGEAVRAMLSGE